MHAGWNVPGEAEPHSLADTPVGLAAWLLDHDATTYQHLAQLRSRATICRAAHLIPTGIAERGRQVGSGRVKSRRYRQSDFRCLIVRRGQQLLQHDR
jgi:hypothetical protein